MNTTTHTPTLSLPIALPDGGAIADATGRPISLNTVNDAFLDLLQLLRKSELALTFQVQGQKVRALRNGNDDSLLSDIRAALAKVQQ